nr:LptF/LptG family permease [Robertkochia solimangrovi]
MLSRFLYNFISSFVILMLIFVFQSIWFFIDEWAGKGIDMLIVGRFLFYYSPNLIPMVLPLTVLLASIMTFGSFAENYEFAAMKSSGISLFRAMRGVIVFITILSIGTFLFANYVMPAAEFESYNLRRNIANLKPAMVISEGIFNNIPETELNIKVEKKTGDNDQILNNVVIHKLANNSKNNQVIKSVSGELVNSKGSNYMQLVLKDGHYYEDILTKTIKQRQKYPFAKGLFETYTMNIDLSQLNNQDLDEKDISNTHKMLNAKELLRAIDTNFLDNRKYFSNFGENLYRRSGALELKMNIRKNEVLESADLSTLTTDDILGYFETWRRSQLLDMAKNDIANSLKTIQDNRRKGSNIQIRIKRINVHYLALHNKFALPVACFILFFVGAPLGAIIRKGGLGLPMVLAISLFLVYLFVGMFATNFAEDGSMEPALAAWISTLVMLPLGIFLTKRATADKAIFDSGAVIERFMKLFSFLKKKDETESK